jgi:hypothetical protein
MKKNKTAAPFDATKTGKGSSKSKGKRKNTTDSTRNEDRQRSGNNGRQQGSH